MTASIVRGTALLAACAAAHCALGAPMETTTDKTLVAWVSPADLTQRGGSALTLDNGDGNFDGIVFGELPEEVREAVLAAHRLFDLREGKRGPTRAR